MEAELVRKVWIGWWIDHPAGGWCPTRAVRDHCLAKIAAGLAQDLPADTRSYR